MAFPSKKDQFQPGNPGGPGRPRTRRISDLILDQLGKPNKKGVTLAEEVRDIWLAAVRSGNFKALQELLNRTEGKAPQQIELTADVNHRDADLPAILAALGLGSGSEAAAGPIQSGGTGSGSFAGPADEPAASEITGPEADPVHGSGPAAEITAADDSDAAAARKKRKNKQVLPGLDDRPEPGLADSADQLRGGIRPDLGTESPGSPPRKWYAFWRRNQ